MSTERHERHPDIYTKEEAVAYLCLSTPEALKKLKAEGLLKGFGGWTKEDLYWREDLDKCARRMFGRDGTKEATKELRLA